MDNPTTLENQRQFYQSGNYISVSVQTSSSTEGLHRMSPEDIRNSPNKFVSATNGFIIARRLLNMTENSEVGGGGPRRFQKEVIRYFKLHLNLCSKIRSTSFCWNKETNQFESDKCKYRRYHYYLNMTIAVVHNLFLLWSLFTHDMASFGISYKMLSIYFTTGYVLCNGLRIFAWMNEKEIVKLVNANFHFEESIRVVKKNEHPDSVLASLLRNAEKSQGALIFLGLITGLSVPTLVFLILLANPCQPPFIGSLIFEYVDNHCRVTSWSLHFAITVVNFWIHLEMVLPMVFTMFSLFFLSVSCLHDYIEYVKRKILQKCRPPLTETLYQYRKLQIMENQLNACFRQQYFPLLLSGMTALLIFCLYSCIRLHDKIPMPGFSYFPIVALDGIVTVLVVNTKAANVLEHSLDLVRKFQIDPVFRRTHWGKKMAWSLTPLKINFMMNFVDKSTPLIFINFALNQVVSLLLVGSERNKDVNMEDVLNS